MNNIFLKARTISKTNPESLLLFFNYSLSPFLHGNSELNNSLTLNESIIYLDVFKN